MDEVYFTFYIMKYLLCLIGLFVISCVSQPGSLGTDGYPYLFSKKSHIPDYLPLKSDNNLRDLLLTLPVFEVSPDERRRWVVDYAKVSTDQIEIEGDGAQSSLRLSKLTTKDHYRLRIGPDEDGSVFFYDLRRIEAGWIVLSRSRS